MWCAYMRIGLDTKPRFLCSMRNRFTSHTPICVQVCVWVLAWIERNGKAKDKLSHLSYTARTHQFQFHLSHQSSLIFSHSLPFYLFVFLFTFNFDVLSSSWWSLLLLTNSKISDFRVQPSVCSGGFFVRCFVDALSIYRRRWAWKATAAWYRFPHQIRGARQRTIDTGANELEQSASKQSK